MVCSIRLKPLQFVCSRKQVAGIKQCLADMPFVKISSYLLYLILVGTKINSDMILKCNTILSIIIHTVCPDIFNKMNYN